MIPYRMNRMPTKHFPVLILALAFLLSACATGNVSMKYEEHSKEVHVLKRMKLYDLLEEKLTESYSSFQEENNLLGLFYRSLDLADFYTYGFVDFTKARTYYTEAEKLNERLKNTVDAQNRYLYDGQNVEIYITEGKHTFLRRYDYKRYQKHIEQKRASIVRSLGGEHFSSDEYLQFEISAAADFYEVVKLDHTNIPPEHFPPFYEKLSAELREYFQDRYRLTEDEKEFFVNYNLAKTLIKYFSPYSLSREQVDIILSHTQKSLGALPDNEKNLDIKAYLFFIEAVCYGLLDRPGQLLGSFNRMQERVDIITENMRIKEEEKEAEKRNAALKGTLAVVATIGAAAAGAGGGNFTSDLLTNAAQVAGGSFMENRYILNRRYSLVAESEYSKKLNIILNINDQLILFDLLSEAYDQKGDADKVIFYGEEAINIINDLRETISSERARITFAERKELIFDRLINNLVKTGDVEKAFKYAENARSRAFVDLLASKKDREYKNKDIERLISKLEQDQLELYRLRSQTNISDSQAHYVNTRSAPESEPGAGAVSKSGQEYSNSIDEIRSLVAIQTNTISDAQKVLDDDSAIIEYYISDDRVFTWVIEKEKHHFRELSVPAARILKDSELLRKRASDPYLAQKRSHKKTLRISNRLYDGLIRPVEFILNKRRVFVVPHKNLHFLPFDVLHDGKEYLVSKAAVTLLPSSTVIQYIRNKNSVQNNAFIIGNPLVEYEEGITPLPHAEVEAGQVREHFENALVLLRGDATKTSFIEYADEFDVVHIAGHAKMEVSDPLQSKIYLAGDGKKPYGALTLDELYSLNMNASLVVLSACETGVAARQNGDELIGLIRGFYFAGSRSIIASLWNVDDRATSQLMSLLYANIEKGLDNAQALQKAKQELLNSPEYASPFFWSAFNYYGM